MSVLPAALPASRVPDPMTAPAVRWGVIGTGWIAERFVAAVQQFSRSRVVAVGSRNPGTAAAFAGRFGIDRSHGSYEELVSDPQVEVVYVATPHTAHLDHACLALDADKHVLVEKPLAINAEQARELAEHAERSGRFCMEALWTLFLPKLDVVRQLLDDGVLGDLHTVISDNGEWFDAGHRIQDRNLGGGPMLDLGTYPVSLTHWVLGAPRSVAATGRPAPSGVNGQTSMLLAFPDGAEAVLHTTILSNTPTTFTVAGSAASLTLDPVFYRPGSFSLRASDGSGSLTWTDAASGYDGLVYEAAEVARRIRDGETGSPIRPLEASIETLMIMDEGRRLVGASFPEEES